MPIILGFIHYHKTTFLDQDNILTRNEYISESHNILLECGFIY